MGLDFGLNFGLAFGLWTGLWTLDKFKKDRKIKKKKKKILTGNSYITPFAEIVFTSGFEDTGTRNLQ